MYKQKTLLHQIHFSNPLYLTQASAEIFQLVIFVKSKTLLFQRNCGIWHFLSGEVELGETHLIAAHREAMEETNLFIRPTKILHTGYRFSGISPKYKPISGQLLITNLPHFCESDVKLNRSELRGWRLVSVDSASQLLCFPEARQGLAFLIERGIVTYSA